MIDSLTLSEMFEAVHCRAMALTDEYYDLAPEHPRRQAQWELAMQQTDSARQLLEAWLQADQPSTTAPERELVFA